MRKRAGFSLIEVFVTIAMIVILAAISVPSFQSLKEKQRLEADVQNTMSLIADARARAMAERECDGEPVLAWGVYIRWHEGIQITCWNANNEVIFDDVPWESTATIAFQTKKELKDDAWNTPSGDPLTLYILPGATRSEIVDNGTDYFETEWMRLQFFPEGGGAPRVICYSGVASYPFLSLTGTCEDY